MSEEAVRQTRSQKRALERDAQPPEMDGKRVRLDRGDLLKGETAAGGGRGGGGGRGKAESMDRVSSILNAGEVKATIKVEVQTGDEPMDMSTSKSSEVTAWYNGWGAGPVAQRLQRGIMVRELGLGVQAGVSGGRVCRGPYQPPCFPLPLLLNTEPDPDRPRILHRALTNDEAGKNLPKDPSSLPSLAYSVTCDCNSSESGVGGDVGGCLYVGEYVWRKLETRQLDCSVIAVIFNVSQCEWAVPVTQEVERRVAVSLMKSLRQQQLHFPPAPEPSLSPQNEGCVTNRFQPAVAMVSTLEGTVKEGGGWGGWGGGGGWVGMYRVGGVVFVSHDHRGKSLGHVTS
ncbi:hypothetical protein JZ751_013818 [Albula glossodonta]|uniref:Uncharacterized protein n=1 Tax=Albula glossodonta TaxID=121402 RepID=A0A8T2P1Y8_9TELE|nr:hypothetical protein JZ751_013818 [Albula glossodonta]